MLVPKLKVSKKLPPGLKPSEIPLEPEEPKPPPKEEPVTPEVPILPIFHIPAPVTTETTYSICTSKDAFEHVLSNWCHATNKDHYIRDFSTQYGVNSME